MNGNKSKWIGDVTCLTLAGTHAAVGGVVTKANADTPFSIGDTFLLFVIDNGDPYRGQIGPDVVGQTYIFPYDAWQFGGGDIPEDFPATCPDPATTPHDSLDVIGQLTVKDG